MGGVAGMQQETKYFAEAYFLTFSTYGVRLHGDVRGAILGSRLSRSPQQISASEKINVSARESLKENEFLLSAKQRKIALDSIVNTCRLCGWELIAAHVRSNHVHILLRADQPPEKVMTKIKIYITRDLKYKDFENVRHRKKIWTRHGSTRYIWNKIMIYPVVRYIIDEQGRRMAYYVQDWYSRDFC